MKTLKLKTLLTGAGLCLLSASFAQDTTHKPATDTTMSPSTDMTPKKDTTSFVSPANENSRTVAIIVMNATSSEVNSEAKSEAKAEETSGN